MKFKVLTHGMDVFVNESMLYKGIYERNTPTLYPEDTTMEDMVFRIKQAFSMLSHSTENALKNLEQCKLSDYILTKA